MTNFFTDLFFGSEPEVTSPDNSLIPEGFDRITDQEIDQELARKVPDGMPSLASEEALLDPFQVRQSDLAEAPAPEPFEPPALTALGVPDAALGFTTPQQVEIKSPRDLSNFLPIKKGLLGTGGDMGIDGLTMPFVNSMGRALGAMPPELRKELQIDEAHRSSAYQGRLYNKYKRGGPLAAPPGQSRHNYGEAVDLSPIGGWDKKTEGYWKAISWLHENGPAHGVMNPESIRGRDPAHFQASNRDSTDLGEPVFYSQAAGAGVEPPADLGPPADVAPPPVLGAPFDVVPPAAIGTLPGAESVAQGIRGGAGGVADPVKALFEIPQENRGAYMRDYVTNVLGIDLLDYEQANEQTGQETQTGSAEIPEGFTRLTPEEITDLDAAAEDKVGDGFWENLTDIQQYLEGIKGLPGGIVSIIGTGLKGVAAADPINYWRKRLSKYDDEMMAVPTMDEAQLAAFRGRIEKLRDPTDRHLLRARLRGLVEGRLKSEDIKGLGGVPFQETPLYKIGEEVTEVGRKLLPAEPGYEDSIGRMLGKGLGSLLGGIPFATVGGPAGGLAFFASAGIGESAERAVAHDKELRDQGKPGLTQDQMDFAALLGVAPGSTDVLPVEILLGRLRVPTPFRKPLARAIARVGMQAVVEGSQEGLQVFMQNMIAWGVYKPEQVWGEGVVPEGGLGAGVGGIAGAVKEIGRGFVTRAAGRRGAIATERADKHNDLERLNRRRAKRVKKNLPTDEIDEQLGRTAAEIAALVREEAELEGPGTEAPATDATGATPATPATPADPMQAMTGVDNTAKEQDRVDRISAEVKAADAETHLDEGVEVEPVLPPAPADDMRAALTKLGLDNEEIDNTEPAARQKMIDEAVSEGLIPLADAPAQAEAPSAEPMSDLLAQVNDMLDPNTQRSGVYLSADTLANVRQSGNKDYRALRKAAGNQHRVITNVDGKNGVAIMRDTDAMAAVNTSINAGEDPQLILGTFTGAGTGKPAPGPDNTVVQAKDADGNVVQETVVTPGTVAEVQTNMAAEGRSEVTEVTPGEALTRREDLGNQEAASADEEYLAAAGAGVEVNEPVTPSTAKESSEKTERISDKKEAIEPTDISRGDLATTGKPAAADQGTAQRIALLEESIERALGRMAASVKDAKEGDAAFLGDHVKRLDEALATIEKGGPEADALFEPKSAVGRGFKKLMDKLSTPESEQNIRKLKTESLKRSRDASKAALDRSHGYFEDEAQHIRKMMDELAALKGEAAPKPGEKPSPKDGIAIEEPEDVSEPSSISPEKPKKKGVLGRTLEKLTGGKKEKEAVESFVKGKGEAAKEPAKAGAKTDTKPAEAPAATAVAPEETDKTTGKATGKGAVVAEPTPAQAEAGNYKKGHIDFQGLDITIETPKGGTRKGYDDGKLIWEVDDMPADYGYVRGTEGKDGDQVDVFVGPNAKSDRVYIIDQVDPVTGEFDEHKVVLGTNSREEAGSIYVRAFSDGKGPDRVGGMVKMNMNQFKDWLDDGKRTKPVSEGMSEASQKATDSIGRPLTSLEDDLATRLRAKQDAKEAAAAEKKEAKQVAKDAAKAAKAAEVRTGREREAMARNDELEDDAKEALLANWKFYQQYKNDKDPERLATWIVRTNGMQDPDGDVLAMLGGDHKKRVSLINKDGIHPDALALEAQIETFLPAHLDRQSDDLVKALYDKLSDDLGHSPVIRLDDDASALNKDAALEYEEDLKDAGILNARTENSARRILGLPEVVVPAEKRKPRDKTKSKKPSKAPFSREAMGIDDDVPFDAVPDAPTSETPPAPKGEKRALKDIYINVDTGTETDRVTAQSVIDMHDKRLAALAKLKGCLK